MTNLSYELTLVNKDVQKVQLPDLRFKKEFLVGFTFETLCNVKSFNIKIEGKSPIFSCDESLLTVTNEFSLRYNLLNIFDSKNITVSVFNSSNDNMKKPLPIRLNFIYEQVDERIVYSNTYFSFTKEDINTFTNDLKMYSGRATRFVITKCNKIIFKTQFTAVTQSAQGAQGAQGAQSDPIVESYEFEGEQQVEFDIPDFFTENIDYYNIQVFPSDKDNVRVGLIVYGY